MWRLISQICVCKIASKIIILAEITKVKDEPIKNLNFKQIRFKNKSSLDLI